MLMLQVTTGKLCEERILEDQVDGYKVKTAVSLDPSDLNLIAE
jgi:hypothetical protein